MEPAAPSTGSSDSGSAYDGWLGRIRDHFAALGDAPLFTTDAELWEAYLDGFSSAQRQVHNCSACRQFLCRFGGLVTIDEKGRAGSVFWHPEYAPAEYEPSASELRRRVEQAQVTGVFLSALTVWGTPEKGSWTHFAVVPKADSVYRGSTKTAAQAAAEKREDHRNVLRALDEFSPELLGKALSLLKSDALYRAEHVIGPAQWLADLHVACGRSNRHNVVWRAVATAPAGFCHPRASMIGTLLEDLERGMPFEEVSRRFADKMHPLQYQRPQAAPTAGAIAQAEKIAEQMGIGPSLERRFATIDEIQTVWRPPEEARRAGGGLFSHLKPKGKATASVSVPSQPITWEKFARTVLPGAVSIDLCVPSHGNFAAIVTAEHADAPPILQWDSLERRNPFSWYLYVGGSHASRWGLKAGWTKVTAVALKPSMWFGVFKHQGTGAIFILDGARDSDCNQLCLFPEMLKSELHGVRSVIEAHSRTGKIGGYEHASACGYMTSDRDSNMPRVRVTDATGTSAEYVIDRWD